MTKEEALRIRKLIENAAKKLTDEEAIESVILFPSWKPNTDYEMDIRVKEGDKLFKCLQPHTSQEGWNPAATPSLWVEVAKPGEYREIKDAMLPTEAFALGEIGWYGEKTKLFESLIPNNVYTPLTYPAGWRSVAK